LKEKDFIPPSGWTQNQEAKNGPEEYTTAEKINLREDRRGVGRGNCLLYKRTVEA
jgi:hypothetical protein